MDASLKEMWRPKSEKKWINCSWKWAGVQKCLEDVESSQFLEIPLNDGTRRPVASDVMTYDCQICPLSGFLSNSDSPFLGLNWHSAIQSLTGCCVAKLMNHTLCQYYLKDCQCHKMVSNENFKQFSLTCQSIHKSNVTESNPKKKNYFCKRSTTNNKRLKSRHSRTLSFYQTLFLIFLLCLSQSSCSWAKKHKRSRTSFSAWNPASTSYRAYHSNQPATYESQTWLYPSVRNLASHAVITSNATCGLNGPSKYCKLVEHVDRRVIRRGQQCSMCDSANRFQRHPIENAIDGRGDTWWQSPTIEQGYQYHWVTITLDLKQVFQVAYVIVKAANSPRPGNWILEKSIDGTNWQPWQYFAVTDSECFKTYGLPPASFGAPKYRYDTQVMCTSYFSKLNPLENGEIHISLINGRPSAENPSRDLVAFTSARYVRLRFQKIRTLHGDLMTLSYRLPGYADPLVTRRVTSKSDSLTFAVDFIQKEKSALQRQKPCLYYYSIKDISIGGMCVCYGHASTCRENSNNRNFSCHCEHNTAGRNCEVCAPGFNQYEWQPGNDGFKCQACNCHGHSLECFFDPDVATRRESRNTDGQYSGGGVCVGCKHDTAGINCQTCRDGFYRPVEVSPNAKHPCRQCTCNPHGATRVSGSSGFFNCIKDRSFASEENNFPGSCFCKVGFAGEKCDRCAHGYWKFPFCEPCPCNVSGSLPSSNICEGTCACKSHVVGDSCSACAEGYFNLQTSNPNGCEPCYCFGATTSCRSSNTRWSYVHTNFGWEVRARRGRRKVSAQLDSDNLQSYVNHEDVTQLLDSTMYYWSAPQEYLGAKLSSYGGYLRYKISYDVQGNEHPLPTQHPDVILEGKKKSLMYNFRGTFLEPQIKKLVSIALTPTFGDNKNLGWIDTLTFQPATKSDVMQVLADLKRILIRAVYSRNTNVKYRISEVKLDIAQSNGAGSVANSVEICRCPPGYFGNSCEFCEIGYWKSGFQCLPCRCHGHASRCNQINGACENCLHNTMGMHCEICKPGFYGNATSGTSRDCQRCACPLPIASNNFSPTCRLDRNYGEMMCLQCPTGYTGKRCEICADGYFGNPAVSGGLCRLCQCNENSERCDRITGHCLSCRDNTGGQHCERCKPAYYGDALLDRSCTSCDCHVAGSLTRQCNVVTGQCACKKGIFGRRCDTCLDNSYLSTVAMSCVTCDCNIFGSLSQQCESDGTCICKLGVEGQKCDKCSSGYYGFSSIGCKACNCDRTNGNCNPNTGECACPPNTQGFKCLQCSSGSYEWHKTDGCKVCACSLIGTAEQSKCSNISGECECKSQYAGRQCDSCKEGFHGYPNCKPCRCNKAGTLPSSCRRSEHRNTCNCSNDGQCVCKTNVIGRRCDQCALNSFGLSSDHPEGCTKCYCSGVTNRCFQAPYVWGAPIFSTFDSRNPSNFAETQIYTIFDENAIGFKMSSYFWRLPEKFNGDKILSYGGKLRYSLQYNSEILFYPELNVDSVVVLQGGDGARQGIQYAIEKQITNVGQTYTIPMREFGWKNTVTGNYVTRSEFSKVLQNIRLFLIKTSYGYTFNQTRLISVYLDVAHSGTPGRGDDASGFPVAEGLEQCLCPAGYTGLSCQDCATGYMRIQQGSNFGKCQPCNCNNRSDTCMIETGQCLNCAGKFIGDNCERCKPGYYLAGNECRKCQCPGTRIDNNFSPTCHADEESVMTDYTCDSCLLGYAGKHCEICADGYYGNPSQPGGFCAKCGCNVAGSVNALCDKVTGQCHCDEGIQGRICDQCQPRHVITNQDCQECRDGCVELLLDELEILRNKTSFVVVNNRFPLPWIQLRSVKNKTRDMQERFTNVSEDISNALLHVDEVKRTELVQFQEQFPSIQNASLHCIEDANSAALVTKSSQARLDELKSDSTKFSDDAQVFKRKVETLLARLKNGSNQDINSMKVDVDLWMQEIKQRNFSVYSQIVDEHTKLTQRLLDSHVKNFAMKAREAEDRILSEKQNLTDDLDTLFLKFNDTNIKFLEIDRLLNATNRKNEMNRQSLNQTAAEIEKIRNLSTMLKSVIEEGQKELKVANELYQNGSFYMNMLAPDQWLRTTLADGKNQIDHLLSTSLDPAPKALMQEVKNRVEDHKKILQATADYIEDVHLNVSRISVNQTEAASRWTNIAKAVDEADKRSTQAKKKAEKALSASHSNLVAKTEKSLQKSNQIYQSASEHESAIDSNNQQLEVINKQLGSVSKSSEQLHQKRDLFLFQLKRANSGFFTPETLLTPEDIEKAVARSDPLRSRITKDLASLQQTYQQLDVVHREVTTYQDIKNDAVKTLDAVPKILKDVEKKSEEAIKQSKTVVALSDDVQDKISKIRKRIEDARRKAASIRESVQSSGSCSMLYKPEITSSSNTEIILNVRTSEPNNLLLYLAREEEDYLAVETRDSHVTVTWDLGGGRGFVENPVQLLSAEENQWYRIEIYRRNNAVNVTVYQTDNKEETIQTVQGFSPGSYFALNVNQNDLLYIGGVTNTTKLPKFLLRRTFFGCMGEAFLQGRSVGLWNFKAISNQNDCRGCPPSEPLAEIKQTNKYHYTGQSYSIIKLPANYRRDQSRISFQFQTFSSEGTLFFLGSGDQSDFYALELSDGRLKLKFNLSDGLHVTETKSQYNDGKWTQAIVSRNQNNVLITVNREENREERVKASFNITTDTNLDIENDAKLYVGGIPSHTSLNNRKLNVSKVFFVGCLSEFVFAKRMIKLKDELPGDSVQDVEVSYFCPAKVTRDIGISEEGYIEIPSITLPASASISMTFHTREPNALLLLAARRTAKKYRQKRQKDDTISYALYLNNGRVYALVYIEGKVAVNLTSKQNDYNDGNAHTISFIRQQQRWSLQVGDNQIDKVTTTVERYSDQSILVSSLFVGGLPPDFDSQQFPSSVNSLNGCVRDLFIMNLVDFKTAIRNKNVFIGTCRFVDFAPIPSTTLPTTTLKSLDSFQSATTTARSPEDHLQDGNKFYPQRKPNDRACNAPRGLAVQNQSVNFGSGIHSHLVFKLKTKINKRFSFEMKVRTLSESGLLLYASHQTQRDFFALKLKDGKPLFQFDNGKGRAEVVALESINDGKWHKIKLRRHKRRGWLVVDKQKKVHVTADKGAKFMDVSNKLYVGGLPENHDRKKLGQIYNSMDICVRDLTLNKNISLTPLKAYSSFQVQSCFKRVTPGAYFNGTGYVMHKKQYRVGPNMLVEMEFRTWRSNGVILSVETKMETGNRVDGFVIEMVNGSVFLRTDNGGGAFETSVTSPSVFVSKINRTRYQFCDGNWHQLRAEKRETELHLSVDDISAPSISSRASTSNADTKDPLFIGGIPDVGEIPSLLRTSENFEGCIRNLRIKNLPVSFETSVFRRGVFPKSCPTPKKRKRKQKKRKNRGS